MFANGASGSESERATELAMQAESLWAVQHVVVSSRYTYVTALLGPDHPGRVVGVHMGMVSLSAGSAKHPATAEGEAHRGRVRRWRDREQGYVAIQSTKPQTLAYGLTATPTRVSGL